MYPVWLLVGVVWKSRGEGLAPVVREVLVAVRCGGRYVPVVLSRELHPRSYRRAALLLAAVDQELEGLYDLRRRVCRTLGR